jgi:predicted dehydrogenase
MSMKPMGVAVAGAGFIGPVHVEALKRLGIPVRGVLGVDAAESRRAAGSLGLEKAYLDYDEVLADPGVQAVHVATPNRLHFDMARRALKAGKHVLCEKPLAMDSRQSAELVALARATRLAAGVNYNIRFYPLCIEAREKVRAGEVGEIHSICGSYVQDWLLHPTDYNWRVLAEEGGELRAVADIGTHWLDLLRHVSGLEVEAVCADLKTVHPVRRRPKGEVQTFKAKEGPGAAETEPVSITTEDQGAILLRFRGGARGVLWVSQVCAGRKNCLRFEIAGARCSLAWSSENPNELWIGRRDKPNELLLRDPALASEAARRFINFPGGHNEGFPDTFKQCFRAFHEYIAAGDFSAPASFPTFEDGHREILLCEAILSSHRKGGWQEVR